MSRPRFTVRRLIVAVAIAGFALQGGTLTQKALAYRTLSAHYASKEQQSWKAVSLYKRLGYRLCLDTTPELAIEKASENARHYGSLREKYRSAMWFPWLSDPPEPE